MRQCNHFFDVPVVNTEVRNQHMIFRDSGTFLVYTNRTMLTSAVSPKTVTDVGVTKGFRISQTGAPTPKVMTPTFYYGQFVLKTA